MSDRIPCIRPGCRRTAPVEKFGEGCEIVCGKCWRQLVPPRLRARHKRLRAEQRRMERKRSLALDVERWNRICRLGERNWEAIRRSLATPQKPAGLDAFLAESGL